jgi:hypothetical protein
MFETMKYQAFSHAAFEVDLDILEGEIHLLDSPQGNLGLGIL